MSAQNYQAEKLAELLNDMDFMTKISNAESKEAMQQMFADKGFKFSKQEIDCFIRVMNGVNEDDLTEADLDSVAGGVTPWTIFTTAYSIIKDVGKACWNAGKKFANKGW